MQLVISDHTRPEHITSWLQELRKRTAGQFKDCEVIVMGTTVNDDLRACHDLVKRLPLRYENAAAEKELAARH